MANRRFIDFPIAASVGDNDIVLIWQDGLNKQTTKATLLQGSPSSLAGLTDVDIAALTNGQILQYNSTTSKWENVDRTDINLSELGDVTIVAPANGQVLVYNSSTSKWENSSAGYVPYTGAVTTVNLGAQSILAGSFVKAGGTAAQFLKANGSVDSTAYGTGSVTSVALTMPTAFSVANSPVTTAGTLAVTATGTTAQYIRGDGSLATFPGLTGFVPYTGATADVNLGTHDLAAERGTFTNNGSSDTLTVNHTSGSGYGIIVTKGGANEALYVSKTSGSGNAMTVVGGRTSLVDLALSSVTNTAGDFLTLSGGVVHKRTAAQTLTDIGGQAALTNPVTGTGTSGQVAYFTGTTNLTSDADLLFDGSNLTVGGNIILSNGANRFLRIGSSTAYYYDLQTVGDDFQIREAGTTPRLTFTYPTGAATFSSTITAATLSTIGTAVAGQNVQLNLNGVSGKAQRIEFQNSGVQQWLIGAGAASETSAFEIFNSTGIISMSINKSTNAATFYNSVSVGGATNTNGFLEVHKSGSSIAQFSIGQNSTYHTDFFVDASGNFYVQPQGNTALTIASTGAATFSSSVTAAVGSLFNANSNTLSQDILTVRGGGASGAFGFRVEANNGDDLLFVNALSYNVIMGATGGNVGIGPTNPQTKLHINGVLTFTEAGFDTVRLNQIQSSHSDGSSPNNNLRFLVSDGSGTTAERMRLNGLGYLLLGTQTSGSSRLRIVGLPTSAAGLSSGDVWNDSGTLKIA
jgi:hypothetical protein